MKRCANPFCLRDIDESVSTPLRVYTHSPDHSELACNLHCALLAGETVDDPLLRVAVRGQGSKAITGSRVWGSARGTASPEAPVLSFVRGQR